MSACAKGSMFDTVLELYEALPRYELQPDIFTLTALLTVCKACNYWEEALSFAEEFSTCYGVEMNTLACNALIATLGRAGRWQYALQVISALQGITRLACPCMRGKLTRLVMSASVRISLLGEKTTPI